MICEIVGQINQEFKRLGVGTETYPYSGLLAEETEGKVKVFDDYLGLEVGNPEALLARLRSLKEIDLETVWSLVQDS